MKRVFCVISNYNDLQWIDKCLGSLNKSSYPVNTIVVDDASTDNSCDKIRENYPEVELIECKTNNGFAIANNIGIRRSLELEADYIFLLNMDAWIEPDTLSLLVEIAEKYPDYGIISPMHLNGSNTGLDYLFSTYIEPQKCPDLYSDIYMNELKEIYPLDNVNAAAWLVRNEVFLEIGVFDDVFTRIYGEDNNFLDRVRYYGFKIGVSPVTNIYHDRENRVPKEKCFKTVYEAQIRRMKVIALNPNSSTLDKILLLFRKSMSDFIRNLKNLNLTYGLSNIAVFIYGIFYSLRHKNRYKELKNSMQTFSDA